MKLDNRLIILGVVIVILAVIGYAMLAPTTVPLEKPTPATSQPTTPKK